LSESKFEQSSLKDDQTDYRMTKLFNNADFPVSSQKRAWSHLDFSLVVSDEALGAVEDVLDDLDGAVEDAGCVRLEHDLVGVEEGFDGESSSPLSKENEVSFQIGDGK